MRKKRILNVGICLLLVLLISLGSASVNGLVVPLSGSVSYTDTPAGLIVDRKGVNSVEQEVLFPKDAGGKRLSMAAYSGRPSLSTQKGLAVTGDENASFRYAKTIDVSSLTQNQELIAVYVDDTTYVQTTLSSLSIRLVDAYDETNYVSIIWTAAAIHAPSGLIKGGYPGYVGVQEYGGSPDASAAGIMMDWTGFAPSMNYQVYENAYQGPLNMRYNASESTVYGIDVNGNIKSVLKADDLRLRKPWKGFTGNQAYLEVRYEKGNGTIIIGHIMGEPVNTAALTPAQKSPDNNMLLFRNPKEIPAGGLLHEGAVGYNYPLPKNIPQKRFSPVSVKRELRNPGGIDVTDDISQDDSFKPKEEGLYSLKFTATDDFGNDVTREFKFRANEEPVPIVFSNPGVQTAVVGRYYKIPQVSYKGGSGTVNVTYHIEFDGKETQVYPGEVWLVDRAGAMLLIVSATDKIGFSATAEYIVTLDTDIVQFVVSGVPRTLPVGSTVVFPDCVAYNLAAADPSTTIQLEVNGTALPADRSYTPQSAGLVNLDYVAVGGQGQRLAAERFEINVIAAGRNAPLTGNFRQIVSSGTKDIKQVNGVGVIFSASETGQSVMLPYPLASENLSFTVRAFRTYKNAFTDLTFRLTDYFDRNKVIEFSVGNIFGTQSFYLNGEKINIASEDAQFVTKATFAANFTAPYGGLSYYDFSINYDNFRQAFMGVNGIRELAVVGFDKVGAPFGGFSEAVLIDIITDGVTGENAVVLCKAGGVDFQGGYSADNHGPTIGLSSRLELFNAISFGTVYTLPAAYAYDLFSSGSSATVKVTHTDYTNRTVNELEEQSATTPKPFAFGKYGKYVVTYTGKDIWGNFSSRFFSFTVFTGDAVITPSVEIPETFVTKTDINWTVPQFNVNDGYDMGTGSIFISVRGPNGNYEALTQGGNYIFKNFGLFTLMVSYTNKLDVLTIKTYQITIING